MGILVIAAATLVAQAALTPHTDKFDRQPQQPVIAAAAPAKLVVTEASVRPAPTEIATSELLAERRCLAEAMYYEARGEGEKGEMAIAEVIFHRMHSGIYPSTVCGVVFEGAQEKRACQFSFVCNGEMERPKSPRAWARARLLAAKIMTGAVRLDDITEDATSYHSVDVDPSWSDTLERTVQIGNHVFYKRPVRSRGT